MIKRLTSFFALAAVATLPALAQTSSSTVPQAKSSTSDVDKAIVTYFVQDSAGDVNLGRLGLAKAQSPALKRLAQAMVTDHTKTFQGGLSAAKQLGIAVKAKPGDDNEIIYAKLASESGAAFDKAYDKELVDAHKSDISLAKNALAVAKNGTLARYLKSTMAIDEKHLKMAEQAQQQSGG